MNEKKTSLATCFAYERPLDDLLPAISRAGFTHVSLGGKEPHSAYLSKDRRSELKGILEDTGLEMDTIHGTRLDWPDAVPTLTATAEAAAFLKVPVVVVHCGPFNFPEAQSQEKLKAVLQSCEALQPVAQATAVRFALENVLPGPATDLVSESLERLPPEYFGLCYDSSHDQVGGPRPFTLLEELADRLIAVHLSDRIRDFEDHAVPGEGFIDWNELCSLVGQSVYDGPAALELLTDHSQFKDHDALLAAAAKTADSIYAKISGHT